MSTGLLPEREPAGAVTPPAPQPRAPRGVLVLTLVLVFLAGGITGAALALGLGDHSTSPGKAATGAGSGTGTSSTTSSTTTTAPPALGVTSIVPASGSQDVAAGAPITVSFSAPIAPSSPMPVVTPSTAGSWQVHGSSLVFTPAVDFLPLSKVTVSVPAGSDGVAGQAGGRLTDPLHASFEVSNGSTVRLQQLLSLLDYSPLEWSGRAVAANDLQAQIAALYKAPAGSFTWRNSGWPARLRAMWQPGVDNVFTRGLIMSFQADHGLIPDGAVVSSLWGALVDALAAGSVNTGGYNWALADKHQPETLTVYHDGVAAITTSANTGIAASPTPDGTFPVFERLRQQVMKGTNPDGSRYADLVQYIAYFHGNDAVHYMPRADYGIPQSLGCIELPLTQAARVWPYLAYGTLVTVIN